mgnify:CR=1 FL=1
MVSVREIRRLVMEETQRGLKAEAVDELQMRCEQLLRQFIRYASLAAGERKKIQESVLLMCDLDI